LRGRAHDAGRGHGAGGFTYIGLLIAVAILGLLLAGAGTLWSFTARREKEVELLFIGHQFRNAIARYYAAGGGGRRYPTELQDLIVDERSVVPRHFLRQIYRDPMTGLADWQVIRTNDGLILGVASNSRGKSIKRANFAIEDAAFESVECYCDWQFTYLVRGVNPLRHP
jgi:type II secretory pathway pseudopilin PulG